MDRRSRRRETLEFGLRVMGFARIAVKAIDESDKGLEALVDAYARAGRSVADDPAQPLARLKEAIRLARRRGTLAGNTPAYYEEWFRAALSRK